MRPRLLLTIAALVSVTATAEIIPEPAAAVTERGLQYHHAARRIIRLADGSDLLIYEPLPRDHQRPPQMDAYMLSSRGAEEDRNFRLSVWIPDQMAADTYGQITSAAMSGDHQWLAFVGGWSGKSDKRGHNGVFLLQQEPKTRSWRVKSWFDLQGTCVGDIAFGPNDTLLLLAQKPSILVYTFSGQNVGSFIDPLAQPASTVNARLVRVGDHSYAIYDPENAQVRFIEVTATGKDFREIRSVPLPFTTDRVNLVGFDPRPDGRVVLARSLVEAGRGKTIVTVLDAKGSVAEEWQAPRTWSYGVIGGGLRGYSVIANRPGVDVTAVTVR